MNLLSMRNALPLLLSAIFFPLLFRSYGFGALDFWWSMAALNVLLVAAAQFTGGRLFSRLIEDAKEGVLLKTLLGCSSAALLYFIFAAGNWLAAFILPGAKEDISLIYSLRSGVSLLRIVLLITFVIGPAEELFWRGWLQHNLQRKFRFVTPLAAASFLYAAVHLSSGNLMLFAAALTAGFFWGLLYLWRGSLLANVVSHVLWDLLVFVCFPFR